MTTRKDHGTVTYVRFDDDQRRWLEATAERDQRTIAGQVRFAVSRAMAERPIGDEREAA